MEVQHSVIGVVGLGSLGEQIAKTLLTAGAEVVGVDADPDVLARVRRHGHNPALTLATDLGELKRAGVVIEAVPETISAKENLLRSLRAACPQETVFITTCQTFSIPHLASVAGCSSRLLGVRLFLPPPFGRNAEITGTARTTPEAFDAARWVVSLLGAELVTVGARPNRAAWELIHAYLNRAVELLDQNYATRDDIDAAMRFGCGLPYGPFQLLDIIGLAVVRDTLVAQNRRPAPLLDRMIANGHLGRKTGRGFYAYSNDSQPVTGALTSPTTAAPRQIARIGIVGSGVMGRGIAEVAATQGVAVTLVARTWARADEALAAIESSLVRAVRRGQISPQVHDATLARVNVTSDYATLADCDLIVEAVVEDLEVKRHVFARVDAVAKIGAVLASGTSSLSVTACAEATRRPADVIGLHFFNPPPLMRLVEIARTTHTADDVVATAHAIAKRLGKSPIHCMDRTGFIVNFLLFPYLNDAIRMMSRDDIAIEEIDTAVEVAFGHPMGPFRLLDTIGLDVALSIAQRLSASFADNDHKPPIALSRLVEAGQLGRKSGGGFRGAGVEQR